VGSHFGCGVFLETTGGRAAFLPSTSRAGFTAGCFVASGLGTGDAAGFDVFGNYIFAFAAVQCQQRKDEKKIWAVDFMRVY
jgi:hypothetical protein